MTNTAERDGSRDSSSTQGRPQAHVDRRIVKTQAAIHRALEELVCEKPPQRITVAEITRRANIHRKTFYLHYNSVDELFREELESMKQDYADTIDSIPPTMSIADINRVFFDFAGRQGPLFEQLVVSPEYRHYAERFFHMNLVHNRARHNPYAHLSREEQNTINTFLVAGTLDMYRQWIADGKTMPLDELVTLSTQLLSHGAAQFRK